MNIVFLGPPGSGKGTQARRLEAEFKLTHLSTGDIFRDNIAHKTPLGLEIKSLVDAGRLVPDVLVSRMVFEKIASFPRGSGFLLDGYPRTVEQASALDNFEQESGIKIDAVVFLNVDLAELMKRLSSRRSCAKCKEVYSLVNKPPTKEGVCDHCGTQLIERLDDDPAVIQERLKIYNRQTAPVVEFYRTHPTFCQVNGAQDIESVYTEMNTALNALRKGKKA